jgi:NADP-dependent 3-hydroxy acid dehydrogenase YdfG
MNKIAFITGATSGIGKAIVYKLAENNFDIIITGRRVNLLDSIEKDIKQKNSNIKVISLLLDVTNRNSCNAAFNKLPNEWKQIDVLVNNAGLAAGLGAIQDGVFENWDKMIDTNVKGLLNISRIISPLMIARKQGHIINIGSIAGKEVYSGGNVYCASKHAVDAITKGMRIDMVNYNIKVTSINPGMVETEFSIVRFDGDKEKAKAVYNGFTPLSAEDVAEAVIFAVTRPAHVNINDIIIMPTAQANTTVINKS